MLSLKKRKRLGRIGKGERYVKIERLNTKRDREGGGDKSSM